MCPLRYRSCGFIMSLYLALWYGMFAPGRTPPDIIVRLSRETIKALEARDLREQLT